MSTISTASSPLLRPRRGSTRTTSLATLLSRATSRRGASMMVRETAARQLEERRADWGYSRPVVALDILWNLTFVVAAVGMLICTVKERPNTPIRVWVCVYAAQCLVHIVLVWLEYRRRRSIGRVEGDTEGNYQYSDDSQDDDSLDDDDDEEEEEEREEILGIYNSRSSITKKCESANTMLSFLWWMVGFYWVVSGGEILMERAPQLYWLTVVFLAFDVLFAIFCVVLACLIGVALCCCLPCIIAILYAVAGQGGASDADISILPKYKFRFCNDEEKPIVGAGRMVPIATSSGHFATERTVLSEDAECCICLSQYEDGADLHSLPCNHHFHSTCVVKWLKMNATCPLCKYNIRKGNDEV